MSKYFFRCSTFSSTSPLSEGSAFLDSVRTASSRTLVYSSRGDSISARVVFSSMIFPPYRMPTRSQKADTRDRLLAMNSTVMPCFS